MLSPTNKSPSNDSTPRSVTLDCSSLGQWRSTSSESYLRGACRKLHCSYRKKAASVLFLPLLSALQCDIGSPPADCAAFMCWTARLSRKEWIGGANQILSSKPAVLPCATSQRSVQHTHRRLAHMSQEGCSRSPGPHMACTNAREADTIQTGVMRMCTLMSFQVRAISICTATSYMVHPRTGP